MKTVLKLFFFVCFVFQFTAISAAPVCISLGSACASALHLRFFKLRMEAYPFDWVVTPHEGLCQVIVDDFAFFLEDLKLRIDRGGVIDHYGFFYSHDWPTKRNPNPDGNVDYVLHGVIEEGWEQAILAVKEKYARRVERFRKACNGLERVYFFRSEGISKIEAIQLRDILKNKYPDLDFTLVALGCDREFEVCWNEENIANFYAPQWDVPVYWKKVLGELGVLPD